jgi:hypothetical protein
MARLRKTFCIWVGSPVKIGVFRFQVEHEPHFLLERVLQQERNMRDEFVNIKARFLKPSLSGKGEKLGREFSGLARAGQDRGRVFFQLGIVAGKFLPYHFGIARNGPEDVVEVVGHAARQLADRLERLRVAELAFEDGFFLFGFYLVHAHFHDFHHFEDKRRFGVVPFALAFAVGKAEKRKPFLLEKHHKQRLDAVPVEMRKKRGAEFFGDVASGEPDDIGAGAGMDTLDKRHWKLLAKVVFEARGAPLHRAFGVVTVARGFEIACPAHVEKLPQDAEEALDEFLFIKSFIRRGLPDFGPGRAVAVLVEIEVGAPFLNGRVENYFDDAPAAAGVVSNGDVPHLPLHAVGEDDARGLGKPG